MCILLILSKLFHKKSDMLNTISISILIIIIFNPYSINSVSMQLSYLGTFGVIFIAPIIEKIFLEIINRAKVAARRGSTFLSNTWRKKMSYPDEMQRIAKD